MLHVMEARKNLFRIPWMDFEEGIGISMGGGMLEAAIV